MLWSSNKFYAQVKGMFSLSFERLQEQAFLDVGVSHHKNIQKSLKDKESISIFPTLYEFFCR